MLETDLLDASLAAEPFDGATLSVYRKMFNITAEERDEVIRVLARDESEAVGSMGDDTPLSVLSHKQRNLYDYFRQQFAQVTNPPIDSLRESIVMSLQTQIGPELNVFHPGPHHAEQIVLNSPILSQRKLRQIVGMADQGVKHAFIDLQYLASEGLENALRRLCHEAEAAVRAVGGAIGRNPLSIVVPCHRVIGSNGQLTGYAGGLPRKIALLQLESAF